MKSTHLLLASNSPRRKELLSLLGLPFQVVQASVDETPLQDELPREYVLRLAEKKAWAAIRSKPGLLPEHGSGELCVVIAADTTVAFAHRNQELILGKPADPHEAETMLRMLRGCSHSVHTGLAAICLPDQVVILDSCTTEVPMRNYSDEEMLAYISSGDPLDKAGAYAIQHQGFHPVESLHGCYANVMGLPLCHLARTLRRARVDYQQKFPIACQEQLGYACPVFLAVLSDRI